VHLLEKKERLLLLLLCLVQEERKHLRLHHRHLVLVVPRGRGLLLHHPFLARNSLVNNKILLSQKKFLSSL
jgi:hypothetical protein